MIRHLAQRLAQALLVLLQRADLLLLVLQLARNLRQRLFAPRLHGFELGLPTALRSRERHQAVTARLDLGGTRRRLAQVCAQAIDQPQARAPQVFEIVRVTRKLVRIPRGQQRRHAIGTAMHIGDTTVKTDLARAFDKLGVSDRTVNRDWRVAKAWLQRELSD